MESFGYEMFIGCTLQCSVRTRSIGKSPVLSGYLKVYCHIPFRWLTKIEDVMWIGNSLIEQYQTMS